ncbi:uncharacterized protein LOC117502613 isoform X4 [Thalassophryne amazonica]|uniref:uncharacterized protein LOC117502613 isoform X4 n=1 Tax=Thalassophryne amazonica TaxID=390379 RepID=UPI0014718CCF|nr:uncharacterized protein LOC117502613 isoform X4 [Thalassophryne amazonica]
MNRAAGLLESGLDPVASLCLPADRVLDSGAVVCPGGFDRHGCPLAVFPVDGHTKLSSHLSKAEAVDFIHYCLHLYSQKREEDSLVSVVADLRNASPQTTSFVGETLCLLQLRRMTVHTAYIVQPKKRECVKLVLRLLSSESFKRVVVKDVAELSVYIDRSQLPASLGGYLVYSHRSWVDFMKEIDDFVQEFLSVVQRLPACISTLQALSMCPLPTNQTELHHFCYTNEAKVLQLRRELGLDELLRRCETVMEKLRFPEKEPCYQAMAGTALFTRTASDMLLNHSRITAAVEKVDYLLQQVFSKAHLQLRVFQLREDALQITEQVEKLLEKLAASPVEIAEDAPHAEILVLEYEASFITPAMALVSCAEDVIHTLEEILSLDSQASERWVLDVEKLKDELHAAVEVNLQTLRAVCSYHRCYGKARSWYTLILSENFLQQLLSNVNGNVAQTQSYWRTVPVWRQKLTAFLTKNPPPEVEELVHLTHLSNLIPDGRVQQAGKQMSERSHSQPTQTAGLSTSQSRGPSTWEWILQSQSSFEDPELSPVCNILSSSSTDTRDRFTCSTEGSPTSLWDSHHLHKQSPDSVDGVILQKDWDIKEQQSLQEVEKILEKTNEILEEEENVLAQEVMLDALMRSECHQKERAFWVREDQPSRMSSHDLAEVGVLGLEDLVPAESETLCVRGAAGSEGEVYDSKGCAKGASEVVGTQEPLPEQKEVHLKDQPNMEKNDQ